MSILYTPMKSVAMIIPIHPKHYEFVYDLIEIIYKNIISVIDIYLVFSNEIDYLNFRLKDKIQKVIIPNMNTKCIVTYKKFYALDRLKTAERYDYFIVCDAEVTIIPENFNETNIIDKIEQIYNKKLIYAGKTNNNSILDISRTSANLLGYQKISDMTEQFTLYYWWSDLPVYKREHLDDFFSKIDYTNIVPYHYDHLIYLNYLLLYHDFNIINITPILNHNWSLESYSTANMSDLIQLKKIDYGFSWVTKRFMNSASDFLINEGSFLIYHLDRKNSLPELPSSLPRLPSGASKRATIKMSLN